MARFVLIVSIIGRRFDERSLTVRMVCSYGILIRNMSRLDGLHLGCLYEYVSKYRIWYCPCMFFYGYSVPVSAWVVPNLIFRVEVSVSDVCVVAVFVYQLIEFWVLFCILVVRRRQ